MKKEVNRPNCLLTIRGKCHIDLILGNFFYCQFFIDCGDQGSLTTYQGQKTEYKAYPIKDTIIISRFSEKTGQKPAKSGQKPAKNGHLELSKKTKRKIKYRLVRFLGLHALSKFERCHRGKRGRPPRVLDLAFVYMSAHLRLRCTCH